MGTSSVDAKRKTVGLQVQVEDAIEGTKGDKDPFSGNIRPSCFHTELLLRTYIRM